MRGTHRFCRAEGGIINGSTLLDKVQTAYLSAGSNLGDRKASLEYAVSMLASSGSRVKRMSPYYETEPVGIREQPWFLNSALQVETPLSPHALLDLCLKIEDSRGRVRTFTNAPRTLDLDIIFYGNLVVEEPGLVIPHPRMAERRFVLEPLAAIAPEILHPVLHKTIRALLESCRDPSVVRIYSPRGTVA